MKFVSWNVNGIRAVLKKDAFFPLVDELSPEIICLQETKAQRDQVELDLPGYIEYWNSAVRKGYSGTAIFTKTQPEAVYLDFPDEIVDKYELKDEYGDTNSEGRVLALEFKDYFVATVYTPNSRFSSAKTKYWQAWIYF